MLLAAAGACALLFAGLGDYALWDPDEAKHALIAREIFESGQWWAPTVNGAPYHHKPSFFYLLVGLAYGALGVNEFAARFVPALACLGTVLFVYLEASRPASSQEDSQTASGLLATGLLLCVPCFPLVGRFANFDSLLMLFITATVFRVAAWLDAEEGSPLPWDTWVFAALATLTKGPVAVLLLLLPLLLFLISGRIKFSRLRPGRGVLIFSLVVCAWLLPTFLRNPDYVREFVLVHNIGRYTGAGGVSFHAQPLWFFIPVGIACLLPWSALLPAAVSRALAGRDSSRWLAVFCCWVLVFFSLSHGKLATYIMPAFPAAAVLVARWLDDNSGRRATGFNGLALAASAAIMVALGPASVWFYLEETGAVYQGPATLLFWFATAGGLLALSSWRRLFSVGRISALLCSSMFLVSLLFSLALGPRVSPFTSDADLAALVSAEVPAEVRLASWGIRPWSFRFYADRPLFRKPSAVDYQALIGGPKPLLLLSKASGMRSIGGGSAGKLRAWRSNFRHTLYANRAAWLLLEAEKTSPVAISPRPGRRSVAFVRPVVTMKP